MPVARQLDKFTLIAAPTKNNIHNLRDAAVVLYRRDRSTVWQVRFKLFDRQWHGASTRYKDLSFALRVAGNIYDRAKFKEEMGIPQTTRRYSVAAEECLKRLEQEIEQGLRPMTNKDYQRVIGKYLVPFFGKYNLSYDGALVWH